MLQRSASGLTGASSIPGAQQRRAMLIAEGLRNKKPVVPIKDVLESIGMSKYYPLFRDAGIDVVEDYATKTDEEVDAFLAHIELSHKVKLPRKHYLMLWKCFRYRGFKNPDAIKEPVDRSFVPKLVLPKKDFKFRDTDVELAALDGYRQRMVVRQSRTDEVRGTKVVQFEVYYREREVFYQVVGLQRAITEWMRMDPRRMIKEDPREEVFFRQLKQFEKRIVMVMDKIRSGEIVRNRILAALQALRIMTGLAIVLMFYLSFDYARKGMKEVFIDNFFGSKQMLSAVGFSLAHIFVFDAWRRETNAMLWLNKYRRIQEACKIVSGDLVIFRLDTNSQRLTSFKELDNVTAVRTRKVRQVDFDQLAAQQVVRPGVVDFDSWMREKEAFQDTKALLKSVEQSRELLPTKYGIESHASTLATTGNRAVSSIKTFERSLNPRLAEENMHLFYKEEDSDESGDTAQGGLTTIDKV